MREVACTVWFGVICIGENVKRIDYYWPRVLCQITGIVFATQLLFEVSGIGTRKPGFEWVIYACAAAFTASIMYAGAAIAINAWRSWREQ